MSPEFESGSLSNDPGLISQLAPKNGPTSSPDLNLQDFDIHFLIICFSQPRVVTQSGLFSLLAASS